VSLSAQDRAAVSDAFARLEDAAEKAKAATSGAGWAVSEWFAARIGAGSSASGAEEDARQTLKQVPVFEARLGELLASDVATHADAQAFIRDVVPFADIQTLLETTDQLSPVTAAEQVGAGALKDLTDPLVKAGKGTLWLVGMLPWIVVALVVLAVWNIAGKLGTTGSELAREGVAEIRRRRSSGHGS
jgi:hypothetical protein